MDFDVEPDVDDMGMMTCEVTKRPQNSHKRRRVKADGPADYPSTLNWAQDQMASFHENNLCEPVRRLLKRHIVQPKSSLQKPFELRQTDQQTTPLH